jgi:hypothetical protein
MLMRARRWLMLGFILHFSIFTYLYQLRPVLAEEPSSAETSSLEEIRELLNKGLTIYEIDQELERLSIKEADLAVEIDEVTDQIAWQEVIVAEKRVQAGKVLRSYYKGKRDHLWLFIFQADNFYDALQTYYYLSLIFKHEQRILEDHAVQYRELKRLLAQLEEDRELLRTIKAEYLAQRERLVALQEELDQELAEREDGEAIKEEIQSLTQMWETKGLPLFKYYFNELSFTINKLPEEIISGGKLTLQNGRFAIKITDQELTDFYRRHNPVDFENFYFSFAEDDFSIYGVRDDTSVSINGYYELMEEENIIAFHLTRLVYNGFDLPDTTIRAMNEEFDLNFYPDRLDMPFKVQARSVDIQDGTLTITFVLKR